MDIQLWINSPDGNRKDIDFGFAKSEQLKILNTLNWEIKEDSDFFIFYG